MKVTTIRPFICGTGRCHNIEQPTCPNVIPVGTLVTPHRWAGTDVKFYLCASCEEEEVNRRAVSGPPISEENQDWPPYGIGGSE